jgi:hypothetical protein
MPSVLESGDSVLALWSTRIFKLGFGVVRIWGGWADSLRVVVQSSGGWRCSG